MRVLFTHRYSMAQIRGLCEAGEYPRHHLWGADALERAGYEVEYGFLGANRPALKALSWRLGGRLGDLEEQAAAWRRADRDTVVYAGEATLVRGLALLRRAGLGVPVVGIVHAAEGPWVKGLDVAVCLSERMRATLIDRYGRDPESTPLAPWGPDLEFAGYAGGEPAAGGAPLVVSAGKTERDTATLVSAAAALGLRARVYVDGPGEPAPPGIELAGAADYATVLADLRRAAIVAIPLTGSDRLLGLSEVNDALALGKPIVMTRSHFDPETIGCGLTVAPHDEAGWRDALARLAGDAALRERLGRRGREFAERGHNARTFGEAIAGAVATAGSRSRPRARRRGR